MRRLHSFLRNACGAAAIEYAIVFPVYLLFIFGTIELGYILWAKSSMNYAASYGSRYAFINPKASAAAIKNDALANVFLYGNPISFVVTTNGSTVDITGTFTYNFLVLPMNPITLTTTVHQDIPTKN